MQCPHVHLVMQTLCLRVEAGSIPTGGAIRTTAMAAAETPNLLRVGSIPSVRATGPLTSTGRRWRRKSEIGVRFPGGPQ